MIGYILISSWIFPRVGHCFIFCLRNKADNFESRSMILEQPHERKDVQGGIVIGRVRGRNETIAPLTSQPLEMERKVVRLSTLLEPQ